MRTLRTQLEYYRGLDYGFPLAWSNALAVALDALPAQLRREWSEVLAEHRPIWRAAYFRDMEVTELSPFAAFVVVPDADRLSGYRREAPPVVLYGQRHDGPSQLERVTVPWCS